MTTRREFLKQTLGGMAVVSLGLGVPSVFAKAALAAGNENSAGTGRTLIVVQLAGGLDGLNTVIPYSDPLYRGYRPQLGLDESEILVVDDRIAFHPALAGLKGLLDDGQMAVVESVGYANPTFSHFKAMDIWQSADPDSTARDGWLGRYFESLTDGGGHPLSGLSYGSSLPSSFESSQVSIPAVSSLDDFSLAGPQSRSGTLVDMYDLYRPANTPFAALLDSSLATALDSSAQLTAAHESYTPSVDYPASSLASGLRLLAELIDSGDGTTPLRVGHVMLGGFDTHTQEESRLQTLLQDTSDALSAFWQDIVAHGHDREVLVMTWSEFGRRVPENAQLGTDHGSAGPMFLIGGAIKSGFYGEPPDLDHLDDANLRYSVDFRSVYATVLEDWLEASATDILGASFPKLDLLTT
jgi:uncharacterized protein (DUF1501 family)